MNPAKPRVTNYIEAGGDTNLLSQRAAASADPNIGGWV